MAAHPYPHPAPSRSPGEPDDGLLVVGGIVLRSALVLQLRAAGVAMTVRDLAAGLGRSGLVPHGRASKAISDALRWECRRGRVRRVGRGTYELGHVPRQTAARMRKRLADARCRSEA